MIAGGVDGASADPDEAGKADSLAAALGVGAPLDAALVDEAVALEPASGALFFALQARSAERETSVIETTSVRIAVAISRRSARGQAFRYHRSMGGKALQSKPAKSPLATKPSAGSSGYSGTPLWKKLGLREGSIGATLDAPPTFAEALGELPLGVKLRKGLGQGRALEVVVIFATKRADLVDRFLETARVTTPEGAIWIAWPKKSSGVATDITEGVLREDLLPTGFVDNKVCAIDATWSALRFVLRRENRPSHERRS